MRSALLALCLMSSTAVAENKPTLLWSMEGFDRPESVVVVPGKDQYLVSNIQGNPGEADGNGFLSLISHSGEWVSKHWVTGLDAPKGLAISKGRVYVADLTQLRVFDLDTGQQIEAVTHAEAKFLNDVTADPSGRVYVTDMMSGAVYRYDQGHFSRWLTLPDIPHPNGISYHQGELLLASWGTEMQADFSTTMKGGVFRINPETQKVTAIEQAQRFANLDTIEWTEAGLLTNDWITGDVYLVRDGKPQHVFNAGVSAADIGVDKQRLLVPVMMQNRVDVYTFDKR